MGQRRSRSSALTASPSTRPELWQVMKARVSVNVSAECQAEVEAHACPFGVSCVKRLVDRSVVACYPASTSAASLARADCQPASLSAVETPGGKSSWTATKSVPPSSASLRVMVIVISPRICRIRGLEFVQLDHSLVRQKLYEAAVVGVGARARLASSRWRVVGERDSERSPFAAFEAVHVRGHAGCQA